MSFMILILAEPGILLHVTQFLFLTVVSLPDCAFYVCSNIINYSMNEKIGLPIGQFLILTISIFHDAHPISHHQCLHKSHT
jgi:hypothetical protein